MSDEQVREPVDNSHLDAGVAARDASKEVEKVEVAEQAAEIVEADELEEAQNETEGSATSEDDAPKPPAKKGVQKRIDELTKAREDANRERDHWREMATRQLPQQPEPQPVQAAPQATGEPTYEDCDFDPVEFNRRHYKWMRDQERQQEVVQKRQQTFVEKESAFRAEHPDYDAVARNPALPITQQVAEILMETDDPPAIAYFLGQNPAEAAAIAQMPPLQMSRAIGRIEANLARSPEQPAPVVPRQPVPKTVTNAPAPVTTLSGSPAVKKSLEEMSQREYEAERRKDRERQGLSP